MEYKYKIIVIGYKDTMILIYILQYETQLNLNLMTIDIDILLHYCEVFVPHVPTNLAYKTFSALSFTYQLL